MSLLGGVCCFRYFQKKHTATIVVFYPLKDIGTGSANVHLKYKSITIYKKQLIKIVM